MGIADPGRPIPLDRLGPGACFLMPARDGLTFALLVAREGRREVLMLNRRGEAGDDLPLVCDLAAPEVVLLRGAFLAPSGAVDAAAPGPAGRLPAALHLGGAHAYLCGRDAFGRLATFEVGSGSARTVEVMALPQAQRWRVMIPQSGGLVTLYEAGPA